MSFIPDSEGVLVNERLPFNDDESYVRNYTGPTLDRCAVSGLGSAHPSTNVTVRHGLVFIEDRYFEVEAHHPYAIDSGLYTLLGSENYQYWVIGKRQRSSENSRSEFRKISVLRMGEGEGQRLKDLEYATRMTHVMI